MSISNILPTSETILSYLNDHYSLKSPITVQLIQDGFNTHYLITHSQDRYILRLYRSGWRSTDDIQYELEVLNHLLSQGVPVCGPVTRPDGLQYGTIQVPEGSRNAVLFYYAPGNPADAGISAVLSDCGRILGLIHQHTLNWSGTHRRFSLNMDHLITQPAQVIQTFLKHRPHDSIYVQKLADSLSAGLVKQVDFLEWGFCHGDFHGGNIHVDAQGNVRVFDFDCGGSGWYAYDLAVARLFADTPARWDIFCQGYRKIRDISPTTFTAIPWFIVTRQLWRIALFAQNWPQLTGTSVDDHFFDEHLGILRQRCLAYLPKLAINEP